MNNRYSNILGSSEAAKKIEQDNKTFFSSKDERRTNLNINTIYSNNYRDIIYTGNTMVYTKYSSNSYIIESIIK